MKQKSLLTTILLIIGLGSYTILNTSYSTGFTSFQSACGSCHGNTNQATSVTITGLPAFYTPSTAYPISVSVANPNSQNGAGFQLQTNTGTLSTSDPGINITGSGTSASHNTKKLGASPVVFNLTWTAPAVGGMIATLNAVGNATRPGGMSAAQWNTASTNVALPVNITNLTAIQKEKQIAINFETLNEENVKHFEIESSTDAINYSVITTIEPNQSSQYSATDFPTEINKTFYYRIKEVSNDNKVFYSEVVSIQYISDKKISIFPTVVENNTVSITGIDFDQNNTILLFDFMGRKVLNEKLITGQFNFPSLNKGLYFITILENNKLLKSQKVILP